MNYSAPQPTLPDMTRCRLCSIRQFALFNNLTEDDFALVHLPVEEIFLSKRQALYNAGDDANSLFTLRRGLIKLTQYLADGSQRVVRLVRPDGTIGLEALVSNSYTHHAEAMQDSELCKIPVAVVEKLDRESPRLHKQLLTRWHQAVMETDTWLTQMSTGPARERVARLCLFLSDENGNHCILPGREDIGAMLGITTETASRIIAEFRRLGHLTLRNRRDFDLDTKALQMIAGLTPDTFLSIPHKSLDRA